MTDNKEQKMISTFARLRAHGHHPRLLLAAAAATVVAACGTAFTVRSAAASLSVDVCSNCHPA